MRGIDVSKWQDPKLINYQAMVDIEFVIARATYGVRPDKRFLEHIDVARAAEKHVGAYHFFRQGQGLEEQLEAFVGQMDAAELGHADIIPTIDLEWNTEYDGPVVASAHNAAARFFLEELSSRYGRVMFYMAPYFWKDVLGSPSWVTDPRARVWLAHWTKGALDTAGLEDWSLWQRSNDFKPTASSPGIDLNVVKSGSSLPLVVKTLSNERDDDPEHGSDNSAMDSTVCVDSRTLDKVIELVESLRSPKK